jgi:hypothetical protein
MCWPAAVLASAGHHCLGPGKTCAVCCEEMPQSRSGVVQLPLCDHMMHEACRAECLRAGHTRCPLCRKSICDLSALWVSYDSAVAAAGDYVAAVPGTQSVACLDCGAVQTTPIHPRHLKCETCASYNTEVRGRTLVPPMTDAEAPPVLSVGHVMSDLVYVSRARRTAVAHRGALPAVGALAEMLGASGLAEVPSPGTHGLVVITLTTSEGGSDGGPDSGTLPGREPHPSDASDPDASDADSAEPRRDTESLVRGQRHGIPRPGAETRNPSSDRQRHGIPRPGAETRNPSSDRH